MKLNWLRMTIVAALIAGLGSHHVGACGTEIFLKMAAVRATSDDAAAAATARAQLRQMGPAGLDALFDANTNLFQSPTGLSQNLKATSDAWIRFCQAVDEVGGQHDDAASHLYWYKDFDMAKAAAKAAGKPILSLRLLGNLDEEFSCANSRFFRATLYPNAEISKYLREHFILHWKSVRPVPRITIDFGDGRKLERTITGNSVHYILTPDGQPVDALPGLYGPKAFLRVLAAAEREATEVSPLEAAARVDHLRRYHQRCVAEISAAVAKDITAAGIRVPEDTGMIPAGPLDSRPTALRALDKLGDSKWSRIASFHMEDAFLDAPSRRLVASKTPTAAEAGRLAMSKTVGESPVIKTILNFQRSTSEDTVRNEYLLHPRLHEWFMTGFAPDDIDRLNSLVYSQLFLMPDSDPWLGLVPANTFTGLDRDGGMPFPPGGQNLSQTFSELKAIQPQPK